MMLAGLKNSFTYCEWMNYCGFSRSVHQMKGICVNFLDPDFFRFLKGRCQLPWQPILGKFLKWPFFNTLAFRNGLEYRNYDFQVLNRKIFATFCAILVKIGPLTQEITQGDSVPFGTRRQKSTYTKYLSKYWTVEIWRSSFNWHAGVLKRIGILQFWF